MSASECSVVDCEKPAKTRGMCGMHTERVRAHGTTDLPTRRSLRDQFEAKIKRSETSACWLWLGPVSTSGYGRLCGLYAHRLAYEFCVGPISPGLVIDHLCRNTLCVNPSHLEPVTTGENIARGMHPSAVARRTGKCRAGHDLGDAYIRSAGGGPVCKLCTKERFRARYARAKEYASTHGVDIATAMRAIATKRGAVA